MTFPTGTRRNDQRHYDVQTTPFRRHYDVIILLCVLRVALSGMALHETEQPEPQIQIGRGTEDYSHHCQQATL